MRFSIDGTTTKTKMAKKTRATGLSYLGNRGQNLGSNFRTIPDSILGSDPGITGRTTLGSDGRKVRPQIPGTLYQTAAEPLAATEPSNAPMAAPLPSLATLPHGLPPWLVAFVEGALKENQTLTENGASQAAQARGTLLQKLLAAAELYLNGEISVEEAAQLLGKHPETIRRAVRKGTLPDGRANPRGHLRIRRGDLQALAAPAPARYDPVADAQDIAQRRRPR
jgi:excisionase family DNA binding protein